MYQEFSVTAINTNTAKKQITIETNKAINNINKESIIIEIYERSTKTPMLFDYDISFNILTITLKDWPIINTDYILSVKGLISIDEESLTSNIKRRFRFESEITSTIDILSPSMFEKINELNIVLRENKENEQDDLINTYYIEIAKDTSFYELTNSLIANKTELTISLKDIGQYYIRARVQKDESNYSDWSDIISFVYKKEKEDIKEPEEDNDYVDIDMGEDEPNIEMSDPLIICDYPEQGITPDSFIFTFNNNIDDFSVDDIIIIRKDVR